MPSDINPNVPQHGSAWQGTKANFAIAKSEIDAIQEILAWVATRDPLNGLVFTAQLGTGVADATTFLRGDNSWAVPPGGPGTTDHSALTNLDAAHAGHTGFEYTVNKGVAGGYAELALITALVPTAQLGTGDPDGTKFLCGDQTWKAAGGPAPLGFSWDGGWP